MRWLAVLLLAIPLIARADNQSVADARKAVDEIRYDDARELLVQALKQGGNRPDELVEIYRLSGATAAVLGPSDLAEQYYRRMLALAPDATLPADASPRLREPFIAAQAYMGAQQRFDARATRTAKGIAVTVVDPLGMVVAVATLQAGELRGKQPFSNAPLVLEDVGTDVVVLDEHGNFLRVIELPARVAATTDAPAARRPILKRPLTWAIAAGVVTAASGYFFIDAQLAQNRLDDIIANDSMYYFDDAERERKRWRRDTIAAWVGIGVALGLTTTALVLRKSEPRVMAIPSAGSDHASVRLEAKF